MSLWDLLGLGRRNPSMSEDGLSTRDQIAVKSGTERRSRRARSKESGGQEREARERDENYPDSDLEE